MRSAQMTWALCLGALLLLPACDKGQIFHRLRPDGVILAFGDDLTSGTGVGQGASYPAELEKLIARRVVNAGIEGESSADGASRLPAVLDAHKPDLVILGYAGRDRGSASGQPPLHADLRRMFETVNQRGIPVVLIAVPRPGPAGGSVDLYGELSRELEIPMVPATAGDPEVPGGINPRKLAEAVANRLVQLRAI